MPYVEELLVYLDVYKRQVVQETKPVAVPFFRQIRRKVQTRLFQPESCKTIDNCHIGPPHIGRMDTVLCILMCIVQIQLGRITKITVGLLPHAESGSHNTVYTCLLYTSLFYKLIHNLIDLFLSAYIDSLGRFIHKKYFRIIHQASCNHNLLLIAAA